MMARLTAAPVALTLLAAGCGGGGGDATTSPKELFASKCGGCHTLKAAGASSHAAANLDELQPDERMVLDAIRRGRGGMRPNLVSGDQAEQLAAYVARVAGR